MVKMVSTELQHNEPKTNIAAVVAVSCCALLCVIGTVIGVYLNLENKNNNKNTETPAPPPEPTYNTAQPVTGNSSSYYDADNT